MNYCITIACLAYLGFSASADAQPAKPEQVKHQVTGLFMKDREQDLRDVVDKIPHLKLVSVDFASAEAVFEYDAKQAFPGAKPDQIVARLDNLLRNHSSSTFGAKPLCGIPADKLQVVEIAVVGLDCKACTLAAYESVYKLDGVERATASFRDGKVTAFIDAAKTNRETLEGALKKRGVQLKGH